MAIHSIKLKHRLDISKIDTTGIPKDDLIHITDNNHDWLLISKQELDNWQHFSEKATQIENQILFGNYKTPEN